MRIYINDRIDEYTEELAKEWLDRLPRWRAEKTAAISHAETRRQSIQAFLLLQEALREEYGLQEVPEFVYGPDGKPSLAGRPEIHFNISHCRGAVTCAVGGEPVGIDIERIRPLKESLTRYVCNEEEYRLVTESAEPEIAFARIWTAKEACVKLYGRGIPTGDNLRELLRNLPCHLHTTVNREKGYVLTYSTKGPGDGEETHP